MSQPSNDFLSGPDNYALAPFLDLLNHRPSVQVTFLLRLLRLNDRTVQTHLFLRQVKAGFNDVTRSYEIRSVSGTPRYQQAFINYGAHDNQRLLLEYGFVAAANPHSVVYVDTGGSALCLGQEQLSVYKRLQHNIRYEENI